MTIRAKGSINTLRSRSVMVRFKISEPSGNTLDFRDLEVSAGYLGEVRNFREKPQRFRELEEMVLEQQADRTFVAGMLLI